MSIFSSNFKNLVSLATSSITSPALLITSLDYPYATIGGTITFTGRNFLNKDSLNNVASILVDYILSPSFTIINNTKLTFVVPDGVPNGIRGIIVIRNDNTTALASLIIISQPNITTISTTYISVGRTLTITGTNFLSIPIYIGTVQVTTITRFSNTSITFIIPNNAIVKDNNFVTMTFANVKSNSITINIIPPLTITSVSPSNVSFGGEFIIYGTGLSKQISRIYLKNDDNGGLNIHSDRVVSSASNYTSITVTLFKSDNIPQNILITLFTSYQIDVVNLDDATFTTPNYILTIIPPMTISSFSPTVIGAGSSNILIIGTNFVANATVSILKGNSSVNCTIVSNNSGNSIKFNIPTASANPILSVSAPDASYKIRITNPDTTFVETLFTFYPPMSITSIVPSIASRGGLVIINGTYFDPLSVLLGVSEMSLVTSTQSQLSFSIPPNFPISVAQNFPIPSIPNSLRISIKVTNKDGNIRSANNSITIINSPSIINFFSFDSSNIKSLGNNDITYVSTGTTFRLTLSNFLTTATLQANNNISIVNPSYTFSSGYMTSVTFSLSNYTGPATIKMTNPDNIFIEKKLIIVNPPTIASVTYSNVGFRTITINCTSMIHGITINVYAGSFQYNYAYNSGLVSYNPDRTRITVSASQITNAPNYRLNIRYPNFQSVYDSPPFTIN